MLGRRATALAAICALALVLRCLLVGLLADRPAYGYEHAEIARNLLEGEGFSIQLLGHFGPTAQQGPLYPGLLAALYLLSGVESQLAHLLMQGLQCLAGTLAVAAVAHLAWALWPERPSVGYLAALAAAVHPVHVYMVSHLQVVTWVTLLVTLLAALVARLDQRIRGPLAWAGGGVLSGLLLLLEPIMALALPWLACWAWQKSAAQKRHSRGVCLAWAGFAMVAVVAPWTIRNQLVFGQFVPVKSTLGYAFWQGNNAQSFGTDKIPQAAAEVVRRQHDGSWSERHAALVAARSETLYIDDLLLKPNGYRELAGMNEPQRSRYLGRQALGQVADDPARYARLCLRRLRYFLLFDETNPKAADPIYRATTIVWLMMTAVGLLAVRGQWRRTWPLMGIALSLTAFHVLVITSARFRIPMEPFTLIWTVQPLSVVIERYRRGAPAEQSHLSVRPPAPARHEPRRKAA